MTVTRKETPGWAFLLVVLGPFAAFCWIAADYRPKPIARGDTQTDATGTPGDWHDGREGQRIGDTTVRVDWIDDSIYAVFDDDFGREYFTERAHWNIALKVTNHSSTRRRFCLGFSRRARVTDQHGNAYREILMPFRGQLRHAAIEPNTSAADLLVIEAPGPHVRELRIVLDGSAIGEEADFRLRLPLPSPDAFGQPVPAALAPKVAAAR